MIEKGKNRTLKEIIKSLAALFGGYDDVHDGDDAHALDHDAEMEDGFADDDDELDDR
ncbi:hypothetical protein [Nonomuraea sp. NPDC049141]|uniref:hypothetical protein n=1 Tax=Nonomuraea sp. NPDC049141 TaxID=3155500 RepID=UPI0033C35CA2